VAVTSDVETGRCVQNTGRRMETGRCVQNTGRRIRFVAGGITVTVAWRGGGAAGLAVRACTRRARACAAANIHIYVHTYIQVKIDI